MPSRVVVVEPGVLQLVGEGGLAAQRVEAEALADVRSIGAGDKVAGGVIDEIICLVARASCDSG